MNRGRVCRLEVYPVDSVIHLLNNLTLITQHNVNASNLLKWNFNILTFQKTAYCKFKGFLPSFHSQKPLSCWIWDYWPIPTKWKLLGSTPRYCGSCPSNNGKFLAPGGGFYQATKRLFFLKSYPSVHSNRYPASGCNCMSLYQETIITCC